jgi:hypothetical protein
MSQTFFYGVAAKNPIVFFPPLLLEEFIFFSFSRPSIISIFSSSNYFLK